MTLKYNELPINTDELTPIILGFFDINKDAGLILRLDNTDKEIRRIEFSCPGEEHNALVLIHLKSNGTITAQYKAGKNQPLGKTLADHIAKSIQDDGPININLSLKGIDEELFLPILEEALTDEKITHEENPLGNGEKHHLTLTSKYGDKVTLHWYNSRTLVIQGQQLYTYKKLSFLLVEWADLGSLEKIIIKEDADQAKIVNIEVAKSIMKNMMPFTFNNTDQRLKGLLLSGFSIRISSPKLADYTLTLFPDLKALEWALKDIHCKMNLMIDSGSKDSKGFGEYYTKIGSASNYTFNEAFVTDNIKEIADKLGTAYTVYHKHRHGLFHANDLPASSRLVDTADKANSLSAKFTATIEDIYKAYHG